MIPGLDDWALLIRMSSPPQGLDRRLDRPLDVGARPGVAGDGDRPAPACDDLVDDRVEGGRRAAGDRDCRSRLLRTRAIARPRPWPPPVTIATFPSRPIVSISYTIRDDGRGRYRRHGASRRVDR